MSAGIVKREFGTVQAFRKIAIGQTELAIIFGLFVTNPVNRYLGIFVLIVRTELGCISGKNILQSRRTSTT